MLIQISVVLGLLATSVIYSATACKLHTIINNPYKQLFYITLCGETPQTPLPLRRAFSETWAYVWKAEGEGKRAGQGGEVRTFL
jgi:hypothetical protein